MNISLSTHYLPANDNQHEGLSHYLLANNIQPENMNANNKLKDDLNDQNEIIVNKEVSIINVDQNIEDKEYSESKVEAFDYIADGNLLQNKMTDHYLDHYNVIDTLFLSSYIKYTSNTWKRKNYLKVGKHIGVFGEHS